MSDLIVTLFLWCYAMYTAVEFDLIFFQLLQTPIVRTLVEGGNNIIIIKFSLFESVLYN